MRKNTTLSLLREGHVALGTWLQLHSLPASRMLAAQGMFHWLLVDFEHTPVDRSTASHILSSISDVSGGRVTPLARVAVGSAEGVKHALDAGAQGIIMPMVKDAREVEVFPDPDRFDIRRDQSRFPRMALAGEPTFTRNAFFRKMVSLPVRL